MVVLYNRSNVDVVANCHRNLGECVRLVNDVLGGEDSPVNHNLVIRRDERAKLHPHVLPGSCVANRVEKLLLDVDRNPANPELHEHVDTCLFEALEVVHDVGCVELIKVRVRERHFARWYVFSLGTGIRFAALKKVIIFVVYFMFTPAHPAMAPAPPP